MNKLFPKMMFAFIALALGGVVFGQQCGEDVICENLIVGGPICYGTFGQFACNTGSSAGAAAYPSFFSETDTECEDDYWFYNWFPSALSSVSNPYGCYTDSVSVGGIGLGNSGGMWEYVDEVRSSTYTVEASAVADMDCLYNGYSYSGTEQCLGGA